MTTMLSLRDRDRNYYHVPVRQDVYKYIRQLEMYINNPNESKLKELYPNRFTTTGE